ncbi:hypothetical protein EDD18DRAFT_1162665 [Armillaria luteobubalina]|uniref:Uncharacterized protein n=1 Tax=Armillaria luteobubalina TaxID=153913 RepID=A0AA39Q9A1_9AGAR|nr:hypothetical protein EDD18DRAFT_1162665 [Armillaria luteobubalina]
MYMTCIITALSAFVFGMSFWERDNLMYSFMLWEIMDATASALNLILADCTTIWRCWVVWAHGFWKAITLPIFLLSEIACRGNLALHQFTVSSNDEAVTKWALVTVATMFYAPSLSSHASFMFSVDIEALWTVSGLTIALSRFS